MSGFKEKQEQKPASERELLPKIQTNPNQLTVARLSPGSADLVVGNPA